ncbi:GNAT family N-acetyltransferase [Nocardioides sp. HDW12B]|uniref:GNAT family N-acetyltransferase n=1 Tax=Nocardioides sp. HDW12B TaxID=2714939 RepID=UPI00140BBEC6|nr:GNAT family N-acetyltransferase [Nocardioides sp. HDW12B]QIK66952.1 GNAT family N-acetyltransferase [Nocardioides sp. HDW12B]
MVRPAVAADVPRICEICAAGFAASSAGLLPARVVAARTATYYDRERVVAEIGPGPAGWLGYVVAESGDSVVGAAGGSVVDRVGHLLVLYLDLDRRGLGLGTALLDHVSGQHRTSGATHQRVSVTEGNEMALPFYRRHGFEVTGHEPFGAGTDARSLVLERPL